MNGEERRNSIILKLRSSTSPVSASALASMYSVTRQIIVADIALLRAAGHSISAQSRGYTLDAANDGIQKRIAVKHGKDMLTKELYAIVDNGGKVLDVIVEHSIYGRISARLDLTSRYDVDRFIDKVVSTGANTLSMLTEDIHVHTLSVRDEDTYSRIIAQLKELNILIEAD